MNKWFCRRTMSTRANLAEKIKGGNVRMENGNGNTEFNILKYKTNEALSGRKGGTKRCGKRAGSRRRRLMEESASAFCRHGRHEITGSQHK